MDFYDGIGIILNSGNLKTSTKSCLNFRGIEWFVSNIISEDIIIGEVY